MLVLQRYVGETIVIGDTIEIKVLAITPRLKLGVTAPDNIRVKRGEDTQ